MPFASILALTVTTWFGPAQVAFDATIPGNPYDCRANDVRVVFAAPDGHREERLAYFDEGRWKAWLTTTHPGHYHATLTRNGELVAGPAAEVVVPESARLPEGFVHAQGTRFVTDSSQPYFPLGHDLCWRYPDIPPLTELLLRMGAAGMNWARIWACAWDEKNPVLIRHNAYAPAEKGTWREAAPLGEFLPAALRQWDELVSAAEASGIRFQFVLFHHGLFSTRADANWNEHPWNRANGGFLDKPATIPADGCVMRSPAGGTPRRCSRGSCSTRWSGPMRSRRIRTGRRSSPGTMRWRPTSARSILITTS